MSIKIVHCILEPRHSGAEMLVLALVRSQLEAGAAVAVVALRPSAAAFECEISELRNIGCEVHVPGVALTGFARAAWIRKAVKGFGANVLFAHSLLPSVFSRLAVIGMSACKLVTVLHTDDDFADAKARVFERLFWRLSAAIVGVSAASLSNYQRRVTSKQNIFLIANGVAPEPIKEAARFRAEVRQNIFGVSSGDVVILQLGRISEQKQQLLSVEAFAKLSRFQSTSRVLLILAGLVESEAYFEKVLEATRSLGVADRVQFLGPRKDVANLLAGADLFLMPSAWEAQGIAALEALAAGIFCVFSRLDAFLSYKTMGGVVILPRDSTSKQLAETLENVIVSGAACQRYERDLRPFDHEKCAIAYMNLARALLVPDHT